MRGVGCECETGEGVCEGGEFSDGANTTGEFSCKAFLLLRLSSILFRLSAKNGVLVEERGGEGGGE